MFICPALGTQEFINGIERRCIWVRDADYELARRIALRLLAASLARLGRMDEAAVVVQELLRIDPELTITKFRAGAAFLAESIRNNITEGLRLAGLPE